MLSWVGVVWLFSVARAVCHGLRRLPETTRTRLNSTWRLNRHTVSAARGVCGITDWSSFVGEVALRRSGVSSSKMRITSRHLLWDRAEGGSAYIHRRNSDLRHTSGPTIVEYYLPLNQLLIDLVQRLSEA